MTKNSQVVASSFSAVAASYLDVGLAAPVVFALLGVIAARFVFVQRENAKAKNGKRQTFRESLPITVVAMLIAFAVVLYYHLSLPTAIFTGLGVGWVTITILDIVGERAIEVIKAILGVKTTVEKEEPIEHPLKTAFKELPETKKDMKLLLDRTKRTDDE